MFAPLGYVNITHIATECFALSKELSDALISHESDQKKRLRLLHERYLFSAWLCHRCLIHLSPRVCSPSGQILSAQGFLISHEDQLGYLDWKWPLDGELLELLERFLEVRTKFFPGSRFRFINLTSGTISVERKKKKLRALAKKSRNSEDFDAMTLAASKLDGWAVCFREEDLPSNNLTLLSRFDVSLPESVRDDFNPSRDGRLGRPNVQDDALEVYLQLFPDGHKGIATWHEVEKKTGYGESTLRRAIAKNAKTPSK